MAVRFGSRFCPHCKEQVQTTHHVVGGLAHIIHAVLTISTGLWGIVWIIHAMNVDRRERCSRCGQYIDELERAHKQIKQ